MSPLTFNIIRQSTQLSAARRGTLVLGQTAAPASTSSMDNSNNHGTDGGKRVIETPGCLMYSVKGSVPHLTPDTLRLQGFGGVHISIEHILQDHQPAGLEKWPFSLSKYLNLQDFILFCDIRDPGHFTKVPFNSDRYLSMMTHQGVRQLTLEDYLKVVRAYAPDIVASFADGISDTKEPGSKRVRKSVERSLKWLDQLLLERQGVDALALEREAEERRKAEKKKHHGDGKSKDEEEVVGVPTPTPAAKPVKPWRGVSVFAHVLGSQLERDRIQSAQETAKREEVDGFIIDTNPLPGTKEEVLKLLKVSLDHLPAAKPKVVYGMQAPEDVLQSIALGVDLFDTSYPFQLTEDGKASLYSFGPTPSTSTVASSRWINLWDEEHADKFVPLMEGCDCYACKGGRHTRAYINHLLKAHEMLATVLLMSHNMHQYDRFFKQVRLSLEQGHGQFEEQSKIFLERFGAEPERTGEIHEVQQAVEAALTKRNRLEDGGVAVVKDALGEVSLKDEEGAKEGKEKVKKMVNKKEKRMQKMKDEQEKQGKP